MLDSVAAASDQAMEAFCREMRRRAEDLRSPPPGPESDDDLDKPFARTRILKPQRHPQQSEHARTRLLYVQSAEARNTEAPSAPARNQRKPQSEPQRGKSRMGVDSQATTTEGSQDTTEDKAG